MLKASCKATTAPTKMEMNMTANLKRIKYMVMENIHTKFLEMCMKENGQTIKEMVMED